MIKKVLLLCISIWCNNIKAQNLSLEECYKLVSAQNIVVKQAKLQHDNAKQQVSISRTLSYPGVSVNVGQSGNFGRSIDRFTNDYINQYYNASYGGLSIDVPLSTWLNNKYNVASNEYNAESINQNIETQVMNQSIQMLRSYINALVRLENYNIRKEQSDNDSTLLQIINKKINAGVGQERERLQLQQQWMNSQLNLKTAKQEYTSAMIELCQLINKTYDESIKVEPLLLYEKNDINSLVTIENLPQIRQLTLSKKAIEMTTQFIKTQNRPRLSLEGGYGAFYASSNTSRSFGEQLNDTRNGNVSLSLGIPILQSLRTKPRLQEAKVNEQLAEENISLQRSLLERDLAMCKTNLKALNESYIDAIRLYGIAEENANLLSKMLETGSANITEYLVTITGLLGVKTQEINIRYQLIFNQRLLKLYGG
jgi:outer membrane protein